MMAVFPVTDADTCCADGWDGKPSEEEKMAREYMASQIQATTKDRKMNS